MLFQKHPTPNHRPFPSSHSSMMGQRPPTASPHYHQTPPFHQTRQPPHHMNPQPFPTPDMMRIQQPGGMNQTPTGKQQNKGIGGLFSNLFSRARGPNFNKTTSNEQTRTAEATETSGSGIGGIFSKMLSSIDGNAISNTLGNVQKVTQMAGTVIPTVQQFGPMVKNLPSLLKIFKEVNTDDTTSTEKQTPTSSTETSSNIEKNTSTSSPRKIEQKKNPTPKMYI